MTDRPSAAVTAALATAIHYTADALALVSRSITSLRESYKPVPPQAEQLQRVIIAAADALDTHATTLHQATALLVHIAPVARGPAGKLAEAEIHFATGVFTGLKLIGFGIWARRTGTGHNVTFPARQYSVNGERRAFALLRPSGADYDDATTTPDRKIRDLILDAFSRHEANSSSPDGGPSRWRYTLDGTSLDDADDAAAAAQTLNDIADSINRMEPDPARNCRCTDTPGDVSDCPQHPRAVVAERDEPISLDAPALAPRCPVHSIERGMPQCALSEGHTGSHVFALTPRQPQATPGTAPAVATNQTVREITQDAPPAPPAPADPTKTAATQPYQTTRAAQMAAMGSQLGSAITAAVGGTRQRRMF